MPSLSEARVSAPRGNRGAQFVGQITDKLADDIFVIWDIDRNRSFDAYNITLSGLRIGDLLSCELSADSRYVVFVEPVNDDVRMAYSSKQLHLR